MSKLVFFHGFFTERPIPGSSAHRHASLHVTPRQCTPPPPEAGSKPCTSSNRHGRRPDPTKQPRVGSHPAVPCTAATPVRARHIQQWGWSNNMRIECTPLVTSRLSFVSFCL